MPIPQLLVGVGAVIAGYAIATGQRPTTPASGTEVALADGEIATVVDDGVGPVLVEHSVPDGSPTSTAEPEPEIKAGQGGKPGPGAGHVCTACAGGSKALAPAALDAPVKGESRNLAATSVRAPTPERPTAATRDLFETLAAGHRGQTSIDANRELQYLGPKVGAIW